MNCTARCPASYFLLDRPRESVKLRHRILLIEIRQQHLQRFHCRERHSPARRRWRRHLHTAAAPTVAARSPRCSQRVSTHPCRCPACRAQGFSRTCQEYCRQNLLCAADLGSVAEGDNIKETGIRFQGPSDTYRSQHAGLALQSGLADSQGRFDPSNDDQTGIRQACVACTL